MASTALTEPAHSMLKTNWKVKLKNIRWVLLPLLVLLVSLLFFKYILLYAFVPSHSMQPYIPCGSLGFANRLAFVADNPEHGDVVVLNKNGILLVKRVIGVPGDTVELASNSVYVNGQLLTEDYLYEMATYTDQAFIGQDACYFVLGDNRNNSEDSRLWDQPYISKSDIVGQWMCGFQFVHSESTEE